MNDRLLLDGEEIPFVPGQTVIEAATAAGPTAPDDDD